MDLFYENSEKNVASVTASHELGRTIAMSGKSYVKAIITVFHVFLFFTSKI